MKLYNTVRKEGVAEQVIEKSRFICYVRPVESREEAEAFFGEIRKKHRDATHNVPCMVIGEKSEIQWGSDDGEPQGTSGAPMVQFLVNEGITNVAVIVTRYFGGTKLGTGGLVRAYTSSAKLGIQAAGICRVEEKVRLDFTMEYPSLPRLQKASGDGLIEISDIVYLDKVRVSILTDAADEGEKRRFIDNITNGSVVFDEREIVRVKI